MEPPILSIDEALQLVEEQDQAERAQRAAALVTEHRAASERATAQAHAEAERIQLVSAADAARAIQARTDAEVIGEWVELAYRSGALLASMSERYRVPALDRWSAIWYQHEVLKHVLPGIMDAPSR